MLARLPRNACLPKAHYRDRQGLEVDFIVPAGAGRMLLVEAKAGRTAFPDQGRPIVRLAASLRGRSWKGFLVYRPTGAPMEVSALLPGVRAGPLKRLIAELGRRPS